MIRFKTPTSCPHCGRSVDAVSSFHEHRPRIDDFSVCLECGGIMLFTAVDPPAYRVATEAEAQVFRDSPQGKDVLQLFALKEAMRRGDVRIMGPQEGTA